MSWLDFDSNAQSLCRPLLTLPDRKESGLGDLNQGPGASPSGLAALLADPPVPPGHEPDIAWGQHLRNTVYAMRSEWPAAQHAKQPHPAAGPQAVPGNRLMRVFEQVGRCRQELPTKPDSVSWYSRTSDVPKMRPGVLRQGPGQLRPRWVCPVACTCRCWSPTAISF